MTNAERNRCHDCGTQENVAPYLVDGEREFLCPRCLLNLQVEGGQKIERAEG